MARVVLPSKFMIHPYNRVTSTDEQDNLYQQFIKHNSESESSKIKEYVNFIFFFMYFVASFFISFFCNFNLMHLFPIVVWLLTVFLLCSSRFLLIEPMWVSTSYLASSVMPSGELSSTVAEI
jgi:hypothetical protein